MTLKLERTSAYSSSTQGAHSESLCSVMVAVRKSIGGHNHYEFPTHVLTAHQSYAPASW